MGISGTGKHSSKSYLLCWIAVHNYFSYPKKKLSGKCEVTSDTSVTEAVFMPVHKVTSVLLSMVAFSAVFLLVKFLLLPIRMFEKGGKSNLAFFKGQLPSKFLNSYHPGLFHMTFEFAP